MIKEYIEAKYGFKVHTAYIAEVKRNLGSVSYTHLDVYKRQDNDDKNQNKILQAGSTLCMAGHAGMAGIGLLAAYGEDALTKQYTHCLLYTSVYSIPYQKKPVNSNTCCKL